MSVERTLTRTVRDIAEVVPLWAKLLLALLAGLSLLAVGAAAATGMRNRRLRKQQAALLGDVGALQGALFPAIPTRLGGLEVSVACRPADGAVAGGDFYDVFTLDRDCVGIIVGDVVGHGEDALSPATFIRHMVRSYLEAGMTPRAAIQLAGNVLDEQENEERFATVLAAVYDASAGTLAYARAGHPPPIVTGPADYEPLTAASSPPAGAGSTTGQRQTTIALPPHSTVCFFTDGLSEARTGAGVFGRDRLADVVRALDGKSGADAVVARVTEQSESVPDDVVVCLIRTGEQGMTSTVRVEELEVTLSDLRTPRLRRFLDACGVTPGEREAALRAAAPYVTGYTSALLRVRMAAHRSGVDVIPVGAGSEAAPVFSLR